MDSYNATQTIPTAPPIDILPVFRSCVVCNSSINIELYSFPCTCLLPIHKVCITTWKRQSGTCPRCNLLWIRMPTPTTTTYTIRKFKLSPVMSWVILCGVLAIIGVIVWMILHFNKPY